MSSENPYSAPVKIDPDYRGDIGTGGRGTYVRQVKALSICMIIQGALEILVGLGYIAMAFVVPAMMNQPGFGGPNAGPQQAEELAMVRNILWMTYGLGGGVAILAGLLRIPAGIRGLYFRGYRLGLVSHFAGMLNLMTCYCIPTSFGLCIWGCIVYFNFDVKQAFKLGAQGHSSADIEAQYSGR